MGSPQILQMQSHPKSRLLFKKCFSPTLNRRSITSAEATKILRPFYLQVHPDFFYSDNKLKKATNDSSLQILNSAIIDLQHGSISKEAPKKLKFYTRKTNNSHSSNSSNFIEVPLQNSVPKIIENCLTKFNLPLEELSTQIKKDQENENNLQKVQLFSKNKNVQTSGIKVTWVNHNADGSYQDFDEPPD